MKTQTKRCTKEEHQIQMDISPTTTKVMVNVGVERAIIILAIQEENLQTDWNLNNSSRP